MRACLEDLRRRGSVRCRFTPPSPPAARGARSAVLGGLAVAGICPAAPPVSLRSDLILAHPAGAEYLPERPDDLRLAEQVCLADPAGQLDLLRLGRQQLRVAGPPTEPVQPAHPRPGGREQLLLV